MVTELRTRNQSQEIYVRALSSVWRNALRVHDPSIWLARDPDAEEKMLRDDDIGGAIRYRLGLIAGKEWSVVPIDEASPGAEMAVAVGTDLLRGVKKFSSTLRLLARAFFSGSRFGLIHGRARQLAIGDGKPRTWWCPVRIEDSDARMYRQVPDVDGEEVKAHWERWSIAENKWKPLTLTEAKTTIRHVYDDDEGTLGHGRALRESLGWVWYAKTHVWQETLVAVEKYGSGMLQAKVDGLRDAASGKPNSQLIADWIALLEDMRAKHVLVYDKQDEVEVLNGGADGWQLLEKVEDKLRSKALTHILGANLTTSADKGGSFALAEVQENSTEMIVQFDRDALEETITDSLIDCVWWKNHANLVELGVAADKPRFKIVEGKRQDPQERANVASTLNGMGVDIGADELYEQTGFSKPKPGEDVIEGKKEPVMPAGMPGGLPFHGKGDGWLPLRFDQERCPDGTWKPADGI